MSLQVLRRRAGAACVAIAMMGLPQLASSAGLACSGLVDEVLLYADGTLNVRTPWRNGGYTFLCNTTGAWGNVPTEVCLGWYGLLTKAVAEQKTVMVWYDTTTLTCASLPEYSPSILPTYVGLKRQ